MAKTWSDSNWVHLTTNSSNKLMRANVNVYPAPESPGLK